MKKFILMCLFIGLAGQAFADTFGNTEIYSTFGNKKNEASEYVRTDYSYSEYEPIKPKTGVNSEYIYAPIKSGSEKCYRHDRNYIYCGQ